MNCLPITSRIIGAALLLLTSSSCHDSHGPGEALFPCRLEQYFGLKDAWGYINAEGEVRIKPQFRLAHEFSDGVAFVMAEDALPGEFGPVAAWGLIRQDGTWALAPAIFDLPQDVFSPVFSEGLCAFTRNHRWGYIDKTGGFKIAPNYDYCEPFSDGLAVVTDKQKKFYINQDGLLMFAEAGFEEIEPFHHGRASVKKAGKAGIINPKGEWVISPDYDWVTPTTHQRYLFKKQKRYAVMEESGKVLLDLPSEPSSDGEDGMVLMESGEKWGAWDLDRGGAMTVVPQWDWLKPFSEDRAAFEKDGTSGYIDRDGKVIVDLGLVYESREPFKNGLAYVRKSGKEEGYLKRDGTWAFRRRLKG